MNANKTNEIIRFSMIYLLVNLVAVGLLILITGIWPITATGWAILLLFGFPAWMFGEYLGDRVFSQKISEAIDPSEKKVSIKRLEYAFFAMIMIMAIWGCIYYYFKPFWVKNFINWHLTSAWS